MFCKLQQALQSCKSISPALNVQHLCQIITISRHICGIKAFQCIWDTNVIKHQTVHWFINKASGKTPHICLLIQSQGPYLFICLHSCISLRRLSWRKTQLNLNTQTFCFSFWLVWKYVIILQIWILVFESSCCGSSQLAESSVTTTQQRWRSGAAKPLSFLP